MRALINVRDRPDMAMGCISVTLKSSRHYHACQACQFETALQPFFEQ
jgi:hypothetical protein